MVCSHLTSFYIHLALSDGVIKFVLYFQVAIYFNNKLMRGNRTTKVDSGAFDAFNSPNLTPLARLEIDIIGNY